MSIIIRGWRMNIATVLQRNAAAACTSALSITRLPSACEKRNYSCGAQSELCPLLKWDNNWMKHDIMSKSPGRHISNKAKPISSKIDAAFEESSVLKDLYTNIVHNDGNFVAISKPRGLSVYGPDPISAEMPSTKTQFLDPKRIKYVSQALPFLKEKLGCPDLDIGISLKSYYSGLIVLCKNQKAKQGLDRFIAGKITQKQICMSYIAITFGVPKCQHDVDMFTFIRRDYLHNREMSVICDKGSNTMRKGGIMIETLFNVKPLVVNDKLGVSLVKIMLNKDKWEPVEALMSHYLSPVLGDLFYSNRTQHLMGVPVAVNPNNAMPGTQRLSPAVEKALSSCRDSKEQTLPLCIHRHEMTLTKCPTVKSKKLVLKATPQPEFLTILDCLDLNHTDLDL